MEKGFAPPLKGVFMKQDSGAEEAIYAQLDPEATAIFIFSLLSVGGTFMIY